MKPIIIANWKMHFSLKQAIQYCHEIDKASYQDRLIMAVPSPYLAYLASHFPRINFCAQNVGTFIEDGAHTGEHSSVMLKSCNVNYSIVGHSERRVSFLEDDEIVKLKAKNCIEAGIIPIICIGEPLDIRQKSNHKEYLFEQLSNSIPKTKGSIIIAYEPIWAIGTNLIPTYDQLTETFTLINEFIKQSLVANNIRLVYGGSVNLGTINRILRLENISGVLVGKASLDYHTINKMLL